MTKTANLRLQDITHKQIAELQEATGISTISGVIMMAVDRMHREEVRITNRPGIPEVEFENLEGYAFTSTIMVTLRGQVEVEVAR
jgi:hypothetical protein